MTKGICEKMRDCPESFIMMCTTRCATVKSTSRRFIRASRTCCRDASLCWKNMQLSSKTWTFKSSYINNWRRIKTTEIMPAICTALLASPTPVVASRPSMEAPRWTEQLMAVSQRISTWLGTQQASKCEVMKIGKKTRTCSKCTIALSVQDRKAAICQLVQ